MSAPSTDAASRLLQLPDCLIGYIFEKLESSTERCAFLHTCKALHENNECLCRVTQLTLHLDESKHGSVDHQLSTVPRGSAITKITVLGYLPEERIADGPYALERCFSPAAPPLLAAFKLERHKQLLKQVSCLVLDELCGCQDAQSLADFWNCVRDRCPKVNGLFNYGGVRFVLVSQAVSIGFIQAGVTRWPSSLPAINVEQKEIYREPGATTYLTKLLFDDGLLWSHAQVKRNQMHEELIRRGEPPERLKRNAYYIGIQDWVALGRPYIVLAMENLDESDSEADSNTDSETYSGNTKYTIYRPHQTTCTTWRESDLLNRYRALESDEEAEELWKWWYSKMYTHCLHGPRCQVRRSGLHCDTGSRIFYKHLIHGSLLPVMLPLLKVWDESPHNYDRDGDKIGLCPWCCNVLPPQEPLGACSQTSQSHMGTTAEHTVDPRSSCSAASCQPQTSFMVGHSILEADVGALLASLGAQRTSDRKHEGRGPQQSS